MQIISHCASAEICILTLLFALKRVAVVSAQVSRFDVDLDCLSVSTQALYRFYFKTTGERSTERQMRNGKRHLNGKL